MGSGRRPDVGIPSPACPPWLGEPLALFLPLTPIPNTSASSEMEEAAGPHDTSEVLLPFQSCQCPQPRGQLPGPLPGKPLQPCLRGQRCGVAFLPVAVPSHLSSGGGGKPKYTRAGIPSANFFSGGAPDSTAREDSVCLSRFRCRLPICSGATLGEGCVPTQGPC